MAADGSAAQAPAPPFAPRGLLADPNLQSILATKGPRRFLARRRTPQMSGHARRMLLECGDGVRLMGYYSRHPAARGLTLLIHGWEGCHDSVYLYTMACALYDAGYSVFRLNLRDHADTHALNAQSFHSARMAEVLGAARAVRRLQPAGPMYCIGFSLGGSFALRIALQGPATGLRPELTIGISPVIDPGSTLRAIDGGKALYRRYFLNQWRATLAKKSRAWPGRFDFSTLAGLNRFTEVTERFVVGFTEYQSCAEYLAAYTLTAEQLITAPAPLAVITAQDDPVIPFSDFKGLSACGSVRAFLAPAHGGHCGFIEDWSLNSWAERSVLELLRSA